MNLNKWFDTIEAGGDVKRFHTRKMITSQNVAQHSFNCALMVYALAVELNKIEQRFNPDDCMKHMLIHDLAEQHSGDLPGNIKGSVIALKEIMDQIEINWENENIPECLRGLPKTIDERMVCKFVDLLDCYRTACVEVGLGNRAFEEVKYNCLESLYWIIDQLPAEYSETLSATLYK